MRRIAIVTSTVLLLGAVAGYASGLLTGEVRREDACRLCRASRYSGRQYGIPYSRVDEGEMTRWYRENIDPRHGLDPDRPHSWEQSACTMVVQPLFGRQDFSCGAMPAIFLLRPEIELEALRQIQDKATQVALIRSLNSGSRPETYRRLRRLIEYYYVDRGRMPWSKWWQLHQAEFGL